MNATSIAKSLTMAAAAAVSVFALSACGTGAQGGATVTDGQGNVVKIGQDGSVVGADVLGGLGDVHLLTMPWQDRWRHGRLGVVRGSGSC